MSVRLRMALLLGTAAALLVAPGARAATVGVTFTPRVASAGQTVQVDIDLPMGCPASATSTRLPMRLQHDPSGPAYPVTLVRATSSGPFTFVVPAIPSGEYAMTFECGPGYWQPTYTADFGPPFRVLPLPATSTATRDAAPAKGGPSLAEIILVGVAASMAMVVALRRRCRLESWPT